MTLPAPDGIEGRIRLHLAVAGGRVRHVRLESTRNVRAGQVLHGRPVGQVPAMVPLLFSVCGQAQALAALTACEQATGHGAGGPESARRRMLLLVETAREHAWRIFLDWPVLCGQPAAMEEMKRLQGLLHRIEAGLQAGQADPAARFESAVGGLASALPDLLLGSVSPVAAGMECYADLQAWCGSTPAPAGWLPRYVLERGLASLGRSEVEPLPGDLDGATLAAALADDGDGEFASAPHWRGRVYETGPLARMGGHPLVQDLGRRFGNGLLTRLVARVLELLEIPGRMQALLPGLCFNLVEAATMAEDGGRSDAGTGVGIGVVEAARGRLVHRVELEASRVRRYQILAPTEWNFHPRGPLLTALPGMPVRDEQDLRHKAVLLVAALDPCVACDIVV